MRDEWADKKTEKQHTIDDDGGCGGDDDNDEAQISTTWTCGRLNETPRSSVGRQTRRRNSTVHTHDERTDDPKNGFVIKSRFICVSLSLSTPDLREEPSLGWVG